MGLIVVNHLCYTTLIEPERRGDGQDGDTGSILYIASVAGEWMETERAV